MTRSIKALQDAGVEPDVWKLEGLSVKKHMEKVVKTARRGKRTHVGVIVLGRGESDAKVREWLSVAAGIPGVIGLAVGRTVFKEPLAAFHAAGRVNRKEAAEAIARNYKSFVDIFEKAKTA